MTDKPYKDSIERLLNAEVAPPHEIARLDRIMQYRNAEAMNGLSNRLEGITETIYRASQLVQEKFDRALAQAEQASKDQAKHQRAIVILTVVLAICTIVYTGITGWSAYEQHQSNVTQRRLGVPNKQRFAAECQIEATKLYPNGSFPNAATPIILDGYREYVRLCMAARGYKKVVGESCPIGSDIGNIKCFVEQ